MAVWTTSYVNNLPDSSFLYIAPGGKKDSDGKTVPRSLRYFPVKDAQGNVDLPHLRNALARIPQANIPQAAKDKATAAARRLLEEATKMKKIVVSKLDLLEGEEVFELGEKVTQALARHKGKTSKSLFLRGIYNDYVVAKDRESGKLFRFELRRGSGGVVELANMQEVRPAGYVPTKKSDDGAVSSTCVVEGTVVEVPMAADDVLHLLKTAGADAEEIELTEKAEDKSLWDGVL